MSFSFVAPRPRHVDELYHQYTRLTAGVPHCLPIGEAFFGEQLVRQREATVLVAEDSAGAALGFAAYTAVSDDQENTGDAVTALFFDNRSVGSALLQECARRSQHLTLAFPASHGMSPIRAYNAGWNGLSDRLAHVGHVLALAGFTPYYRELSMIGDLDAIEHTPVDVPGIDIQFFVEEDGSFRQQAIDGEQKSGVCSYYLLARYTDDPRATRIGYIDGLWVPERARRRGIGRALMLHALAHVRALGCTECWLTTGADNWPAQPLYLALGFAFVDCSASFKRR